MKDWKRKTTRRAFNDGAKVAEGCQSETCPFRDENRAHTVPQPCDCAEKMRGIVNQIERDLKKEGI